MTNARERRLTVTFLSALAAAAMVFFATAVPASAQKSFTTTDAAAEALVKAARDGDRKAMLDVLGPHGSGIVSSGDTVADEAAFKRFVAAYDAKHQLTMEGDSKAIMVIGQEDFPFPVPLVKRGGAWQFDTDAGLDEILYRRIGRNELDVIETCLAFVDAEDEYAEKDRTGAGVGVYAQRIVSSPGKKDGLYWPDAQGNDVSPLGEFAAEAAAQGYRARGGRTPYHGYYYKILTRQGPAAAGGELDYVVHGKMIGGFALVAYPAEYRNSGVMTFIVNHAGVVYQKDLGPRTAKLAEDMKEFNPDSTWAKVPSAGN